MPPGQSGRSAETPGDVVLCALILGRGKELAGVPVLDHHAEVKEGRLLRDPRRLLQGVGLSGGQQQRLCIARAIAVNPEVILMDEPCSALDPIATAKIEELIEELRENYTIIMVTHSMQQAARVSQKTAFFHLGSLVEFGETEQIFTNPQDKRTESYISGRIG